MRRYWKYEKKDADENSDKKRMSLRTKLILASVVLLLAAVGGGIAKYIWDTISDYAAVTSAPFYFTVDVFGDSEMTKKPDSSYSYEDPTGAWSLYGGGEHSIPIRVRNYYDELRVTQNEITYSVSLKDPGKTGATITAGSKDATTGTLSLGKTDDGKLYDAAEQQLTLTIPDDYEDGSVITVTIESERPYVKTMTLSFTVYTVSRGLTYKVIDSDGSPFAELVIMNGTEEDVTPVITWNATKLFIDDTNELTFTATAAGDSHTFTKQFGIETGEMEVSKAIASHQSVSIYFFKANSSEKYSQDVTTVAVDSGDQGIIALNQVP